MNGILETRQTYTLCGKDGSRQSIRFSTLYTFIGLRKVAADTIEAGDIAAFAGVENLNIGDTVSSLEKPLPLPRIQVDEPTVSMLFFVNNGPLAGREGKFLTSRHLSERLERETMQNVAIRIKPTQRPDSFEVCGRGELQMAIIIETMRREGYEFTVSKPHVITKTERGGILEPVEQVFIDVPEEFIGVISERLAARKGRMVTLTNRGSGRVNLEFVVPSRGLIGFRSRFLTDTKGSGVMNTLFAGYQPWAGEIPQRATGALVADRPGRVSTYACHAMADRGELIVSPGTEVYAGMIIGERNRSGDLDVNIVKEKKLTNMRSSTSDQTVILRPARLMSLEECIDFIAEDELIEITPETIRLRKEDLGAHARIKSR